jgi:hypothetical protein
MAICFAKIVHNTKGKNTMSRKTKPLEPIKAITMNNEFETLKKMYLIHSPSKNEKDLSRFVQWELKKMGIPFKVDSNHQIYRFNKSPMISSHMDQVRYAKPCSKVWETKNTIIGDGNLGADDKNGVFLILETLKKFPGLSFIFSCQEEIGQPLLMDLLDNNEDELTDIPYCLVLDRRGKADIIGTYNQYCEDDFETQVEKIASQFGYAINYGVWSDADVISEYLACVNLSVGYYNAHSTIEHTNKKTLRKALKAVLALVKGLPHKSYEIADKWEPDPMWSKYRGHGALTHSGTTYDHNYGYETELDEAIAYCPSCYKNLADYEIVSSSDHIDKCWYCMNPVDYFESTKDRYESYASMVERCDMCDAYKFIDEMIETTYGMLCNECHNYLYYGKD